MAQQNPTSREPDWKGPGWKHPYVIYIVLTALLFGFLVLMGYLAWDNGWIPRRGVGSLDSPQCALRHRA